MKPSPEPPPADPNRMTFLGHLEELRKRLVVSAALVAIGFVVCWFFAEDLFRLLLSPLLAILPEHRGELIFTGLTEPFILYMKVALIFGVLFTSPFLFYQVWAFVSPGLRPEEKKYAVPFVLLAGFFFVGGALFGYFVLFPVAFKYFLSLTTTFFSPKISIREYLGFAVRVLAGFGLVFELPLLATILARFGLIDDLFLRKYRKYSIVIAFILAAVLTPGPDVVSQLILAGPLLVLYEVSIVLAKIFKKKKVESSE